MLLTDERIEILDVAKLLRKEWICAMEKKEEAVSDISKWIELLKQPLSPFAAASLILILFLLLRWLRKKQHGVPLDGKKYVFLATLAGMFAVLAKTWKPDDAWYANLLAVLGVFAGGALSWEGASEPAKVEEPSFGLQQHEKRLQILEQLVLAKQAEIAPGDEKGRYKVEQELKAVQAKLADVKKSWEEEQKLHQETKADLAQLKGLLPDEQLKKAEKSLAQGDKEEAEQAFDAVAEKDGKVVALAAHRSGKLAEDRVDYEKAMRMYRTAVLLEKDNPDYLLAAGKMARTLGDYAQAQEWLERLLKIREAERKDDVELAIVLNELAELYYFQGQYKEAELLLKRSLKIREQKLGKDHPDVAESLNNLALLYYSQGRYKEAEPLYQRSLDISEQSLGKDHPDVAITLNNLAVLYDDQSRYAEAELLYQRSLEIREQKLGKDHPDVAASLNNLAGLYKAQGKYTEAEPLYKRSLEIWEKSLGKDHPDVAAALNNLAGLYDDQKLYEKAEPLYKRSLEICEKVLGKDHPFVATTLHNLAGLYKAQGKYAEAEPLYQRCLAILRVKFPGGHPNIDTTQKNYDELKRKMAGQ